MRLLSFNLKSDGKLVLHLDKVLQCLKEWGDQICRKDHVQNSQLINVITGSSEALRLLKPGL